MGKSNSTVHWRSAGDDHRCVDHFTISDLPRFTSIKSKSSSDQTSLWILDECLISLNHLILDADSQLG